MSKAKNRCSFYILECFFFSKKGLCLITSRDFPLRKDFEDILKMDLYCNLKKRSLYPLLFYHIQLSCEKYSYAFFTTQARTRVAVHIVQMNNNYRRQFVLLLIIIMGEILMRRHTYVRELIILVACYRCSLLTVVFFHLKKEKKIIS